jgi:hypothetical protein
MTTTILAVIALTGSLVPAAKPEFHAQTDYGRALKQAADERKPMAVLIGKGDTFAQLTESGLSAEARKLLADKYVCVSVDVGTDAGKALAGQFQLTDGLVISSAGGTYQALRQSGTVSASDLSKHAAAYAGATGVPATTVTVGVAAPYTSNYAPASYGSVVPVGGCAGGNCSGGGYSYPGSSCPNGRCPGSAPRFFR